MTYVYVNSKLLKPGVITWKANGEPKLGPCPEKWLPLIPVKDNNFELLQKCISHINVTLLKSKVTKLDDAINACSHIFGNGSTTATIFRPDDKKELKNFLTFAASEELEGMLDIFIEGKAPYDHSGNDLRQLGETITNAMSNAPDKSCAWNLLKGEIQFKNCDSFTTLWCQYKAKPVMTNYGCNGWFKADHGSHYRTTARNARNICRKKKAQLVTINNIGEWSYVTRLADTLAPNTIDRSLLLGYTRCSTDPPEWRTMEGDISAENIPFPDATTSSDAECCLQLDIDNKINCKRCFYYLQILMAPIYNPHEQIKLQEKLVEGAQLQATICNKKVNYFICKKEGMFSLHEINSSQGDTYVTFHLEAKSSK
uniref:C-type lectin domain-containing protein n=1 Tax=Wuchereria bancrofti TaxID=6293 RepID=A0A1I8EDC0_WUCBA